MLRMFTIFGLSALLACSSRHYPTVKSPDTTAVASDSDSGHGDRDHDKNKDKGKHHGHEKP